MRAHKQAKQLGLNVKFYSAYWAGSRTFLDNARELAEGIVYVDLPSARQALSGEGAALFEQFEKKYGKMNSIELIFATSFEAFRALHKAIESGRDIREYLYSTKFKGLFGDWSFDKNGDIQGLGFVIREIKNGKGVNIAEPSSSLKN